MDVFAHLLLACAMQALVARSSGSWFAGAAVASAWAISREITQAEYRWIERFGDDFRANMPWWGGFDPSVWQKPDPWLDWIIPTAVTFAIAFWRHAERRGQARRRPE